MNVPSFYEQIVTGAVVLIAVAIDQGSKGWPMLGKDGGGKGDAKSSTPMNSDPAASANVQEKVTP